MVNYRYYSADILTGAVQAELPLFGVWFGRQLSTTGEMTGSFRLGSGLHNDTELLQGSLPGKTALYVERDGALIWGGIIWSRTYAPESLTCQLTGQTFESIFPKVALESDFVQQTVDQMQIFKNLITAIQQQPYNNFGLDTSQVGSSGIFRTILIPGYEYHFAQEVVDEIVGVDSGFDYTIDVLPSGITDQPNRVVRAGYPTLSSVDPSDMVFDYPGSISNYWWPESGGKGATKHIGIGAGAGIAMLRTVAESTDLLAAGYPAWYNVNSYKGITDANQLISKTAADEKLNRMPVSVPTFELKPDRIPSFEGWNQLGDNIELHVEDARFPNGMDVTTRMIGWELTVADSEDEEMLKFTIEGGDDAGA